MRQIQEYIAYPGIFNHIQTYPGMFSDTQSYSEPCVSQTYLEHWYIQNPGINRTLAYSERDAYSELCQASTMWRFAEILND